jgi:hypothetical protein
MQNSDCSSLDILTVGGTLIPVQDMLIVGCTVIPDQEMLIVGDIVIAVLDILIVFTRYKCFNERNVLLQYKVLLRWS